MGLPILLQKINKYRNPDNFKWPQLLLLHRTIYLSEAAFLVNHLLTQLHLLDLRFCQRCAVDAMDQQGATALHVAAERGCVEVCWTLLQRTGCRMLHEKTHSGLTPLELCKQGKTFR